MEEDWGLTQLNEGYTYQVLSSCCLGQCTKNSHFKSSVHYMHTWIHSDGSSISNVPFPPWSSPPSSSPRLLLLHSRFSILTLSIHSLILLICSLFPTFLHLLIFFHLSFPSSSTILQMYPSFFISLQSLSLHCFILSFFSLLLLFSLHHLCCLF